MKDENKCETDYCRNDWDINYLGKKLCNECWENECNENDSD